MVPRRVELTDPPMRLRVAIRVAFLVVVAGLSVAATGDPWSLAWCGLLAVTALPALLGARHGLLARLGRIGEVTVAALAAASLAHPTGTTLAYLPLPVFVAAMYLSALEGFALVGLAALVLVIGGLPDDRLTSSAYLVPAAQWLALVTMVAALGGWLNRMLRANPTQPQPYAEATRLLTQLRTVARQLPGTLDPGGIATNLLDEVPTIMPVDRAAVLGRSGGGRLVVLAQRGPDRVDWETSVDADTPIAEAWASQLPHASARSLTRSRAGAQAMSSLVVPLVAGVRTIGLLVIEADQSGAYPQHLVDRVARVTAANALRLEAALLFDEVRSLATTEERQRLAREIHDGVAQELVMVGYGIDNALGQLPESATTSATELKSLRGEVTRVITELRLSLFELRTDVDRHGGLGTAIADYARTIGASGGLRVHLSLDESTARLPAAIEAELLRIAQEAITNARKHARAENLWTTIEVDPPYARVEISDDGQGISERPPDRRYGLAIMAERAERIRAVLDIRPRHPTGTTVIVVLGTPPRHVSVSAAKGVSDDNVHQPDSDRAHPGAPG